MSERRWEAGFRDDVSGLTLRTVPGKKFPGDLKLEVWTGTTWYPVKMELAFYLADFFTENEQERKAHMNFWRLNGDYYFMKRLFGAVKNGWRVEADRIEQQRLG